MAMYLRLILMGAVYVFSLSIAQANEPSYWYLSAQHSPESIRIIKGNEMKGEYSLIFTDVEYDYEIDDGSKPNQPIKIWEEFYGLRFYIPQDFSKDLETWAYGECAFSRISANWFDSADPIYMIESKCDDNRNARYHYSVSNGLQLMIFGRQEECGRDHCPFDVSDAYFLYRSIKGFGAKPKNAN